VQRLPPNVAACAAAWLEVAPMSKGEATWAVCWLLVLFS